MSIPQNLEHLRNSLRCPLSRELFRDPVTEEEGTCGHTFEAAWIREWLRNNKTCPLSKEPLRLNQLVRNGAVRAACALLHPDRVTPLTQEELNEINAVITDVGNQDPVSKAVHNSLAERVRKGEELPNWSLSYYDIMLISCFVIS